jgi:hypothetical protein
MSLGLWVSALDADSVIGYLPLDRLRTEKQKTAEGDLPRPFTHFF